MAIRAVISDFGGVLTTPLLHSFVAFQDETGISLESLGKAMQRAAEENGAYPLFELEKGKLTEELIVDSAYVGMRKPEREIYELTLDRLGAVTPPECIFIDDTDLNCDAARELGMTAVNFKTNEQAIAEIEAALGNR